MHDASRFDGDPYLAHVRSLAMGLPEAAEKASHGHPVFYTKKIFAIFGGKVKGDHHSGRYDQSLLVLPESDERAALLEDGRFFVPAYYGPSGWVGFDFRTAAAHGDVDWDEVAHLLDESYRNTAPARLVRLLDQPDGDSPNRDG